MAQTRKYKIGCSGSGWGVWEISTGRKVASCGMSRFSALDKWFLQQKRQKHYLVFPIAHISDG